LLVVGAVAALLLGGGGGAAKAASITYNVDDRIGQGSVVGSITTDGKIGALSTGNVTAWNLTLSGVGQNATFTLTTNNSHLLVQGTDFTATPSDLFFNYSGSGLFLFQTQLFSGSHYWCNSAAGGACYQGASVVPQNVFDGTAQHVGAFGESTLGIGSGVNYYPGYSPTAQTVKDGPYTDNLTYGVAHNPPNATVGSKGLFHYTYELSYTGSATLVLPLFQPGDIQNLTGGCSPTSPTFAGGETLQQVFGTAYNSAIACALPNVSSTTIFDFSFDSVYAPTQVTMGLEDASGVVSLVDPPAPDDRSRAAIPEPSTWMMMAIGFGGLGLLALRRRKVGVEGVAAR
jgi:hypothetical protein